MAHLGIVCPPVSGHLNPQCWLGRELAGRGHRVTLIAPVDIAPKAAAAGLEFRPIALDECPPGEVAKQIDTLSRLTGWRALRFTGEYYRREVGIQLRELPGAIRELRLDGLVADQTCVAAGTAADAAGIPFVSVAAAGLLNREPGVPNCMMSRLYRNTPWARGRNRFGHWLFDRAFQRIGGPINAERRRRGLPTHRRIESFFSPLAEISQFTAEFDFPREFAPPVLHYVGPLCGSDAWEAVPFPFERLDGRPLVYAATGTLQNGRLDVFRTIAEACIGLDVQLVISLGRKDAEIPTDLPGSPIVVGYAPQVELLKRAALTVTHAGLNTVMGSLAAGVPMVAVPITNEQPGLAARVVWNGAGLAIPLRRLSADRLRSAIGRVLQEDSFRRQAQRLQAGIERAGGVRRAADIVEQAIVTGKPVLSGDVRQQHSGLRGPTRAAASAVRAS